MEPLQNQKIPISTIAFQGKILVLDRTIRHFKNLVKRHKNAMNETTEKKAKILIQIPRFSTLQYLQSY
jgi:phosphopantothenate synthetase